MKYKDRLTGGFVETDKELGSRYERVHEGDPCWCEEPTVILDSEGLTVPQSEIDHRLERQKTDTEPGVDTDPVQTRSAIPEDPPERRSGFASGIEAIRRSFGEDDEPESSD